jgi:inorganic phosphate transporter, PiT family
VTKTVLDRDLKKVVRLEEATYSLSRSFATPGLAALFLGAVILFVGGVVAEGPLSFYVIAAGVIAGYLALNVGANDVANNVGPAVGGKALSMAGALVIAAICEAAGALLAGGDVVATVSKDIIRPDPSMAALEFILVMMAGFLAAAMWIHLATYLGAPVSTTHAVVGGVLGAGIAASGPGIVSWSTMAAIAASWVISPALGGMVAAALLWFVKWAVLGRDDRVLAARRWVPVLIGLMAGVFAMYLSLKGLSRVWTPPLGIVWLMGAAGFVLGWSLAHPWTRARSQNLGNRRKHISSLFTLPLIFAAALLSFAHGANDVANAVGPLAAIVAAAQSGQAAPSDVVLPLWVLLIGAIGISLGLALFGPRLIRTVGEKITKMDSIRAYCVALSAAVTVLIASALGMPVSSTHIAIGGVFGVGFLREALTNKGIPNPAVHPRTRFLKVSALNRTPEEAVLRAQKREKRRLVRRRHVIGIGAAWVITVPAAGLVAAILYVVMNLAVTL